MPYPNSNTGSEPLHILPGTPPTPNTAPWLDSGADKLTREPDPLAYAGGTLTAPAAAARTPGFQSLPRLASSSSASLSAIEIDLLLYSRIPPNTMKRCVQLFSSGPAYGSKKSISNFILFYMKSTELNVCTLYCHVILNYRI